MQYNYIIYILIFPNGKAYIGQCNDFNIRMNRHKNDSFNKNNNEYNLKIGRAIRKYGWENIKKEIICTVSEEFVDELETQMIAKYNATDKRFGYNILKEAKTMRGFKHSEETKEKISKNHLGKKHSVETKIKIRKNLPDKSGKNNPFYGRTHSEKIKQKLRKSINLLDTSEYFIKRYNSITDASIELNISVTSISNNLNKRSKTAGGYIFNYG